MKRSSLTASDAKLWQRLLLVALAGTVPLFIVSLVLITKSYSGRIDFIVQERRGIAFQRPLEQLLDLLPRYQAAARQSLAGDGAAAPILADLRQQIDRAVDLVAANYMGDQGQALGFTDEKLALRNRGRARLSVLQAHWTDLRSAPLTNAARSDLTHQMTGSIREMIAHAGDLSNLILDDRLNSFYLMDITVGALPQTQQRLSDIILQVGDWLRAGLTDSNRTQVALLAELAQQDDENRITRDAKTSMDEDVYHHGFSESLHRNLPPAVANYVAANQAFLTLLKHVAAGANVSAAELEAAGWEARAESFRLSQVGEDELDQLLSTRISFIRNQRLQYYLVIGLTLAFAGAVMGWIIRGLLKARYAELLRNEEVLRASEEKFSKAFQANPSAIMLSDLATGQYIEVNESGLRLWGYSRQEMIGHSALELGIWKNAEDRNRMLQPLQESGSLRDLEVVGHTRDGHVRTVLVNAELIELGGKERIVSLLHDITERKRAQEEMLWKTAFLEAQDDRAKKILQNERLFQLFKVPDDIAHDDDDSRLLEHVSRQTKNPKQFNERVAHLYAHRDEVGRDELALQDGSILDRYSAPVRDQAGKYYGRIWTFRDITEHRKVEEQFRQAQKMEAIGTLAGGIAHDFNNILAAINGYTELAKRRVTADPVTDKFLDAVLEGGTRAAALVRQILAFSRQQEHQRSLVQLRHVVAEPLKLLRATIPSTIEFNVSLASSLPAVLADATQIHQIVMNLCTNAAHAMRDRPGRLAVRLENFTVDALLAESTPGLRAGPYVRLSISDTGHGMSEATKARIFEPFFTTKGPGEGTGLGLSVVHGIMQTHGGAITVYSQPGEGSVFHLYFPASDGEAAATAATSTAIPAGNGARILIVDDEKALALLGQKMLEELGYVVENTTSAAQALALVRANPEAFDLVITDLTMPGMLGTELARELLLLRPDLPVILTTGYTATLTEERVREQGIRELLLKPHTLQSLGVTIHHVLTTPPDP
jgi:PAS domain S-box-containing protein